MRIKQAGGLQSQETGEDRHLPRRPASPSRGSLRRAALPFAGTLALAFALAPGAGAAGRGWDAWQNGNQDGSSGQNS